MQSVTVDRNYKAKRLLSREGTAGGSANFASVRNSCGSPTAVSVPQFPLDSLTPSSF